MRTSLNEIALLEQYIKGELSASERLCLEARFILNPKLKAELAAQQETYHMVKLYGRKQLRKEIEAAHQQLFSEPRHKGFKQRIMALFN